MSIDQLAPEELIVLCGRWHAQLVYLENVRYQYENGFISEEHWQTNRAELTGMLMRTPEWRRAMVENCDINRVSFCAEIRAASERIELGKE